MTTEQLPQVTLTPAPITHVWATISETEFERKQRRVFCLRAERGLAITESGYHVYTFTHIPSGKRFTDDLSDKQALAAFDDVLALTDWTADAPSINPSSLAVSLVALGLIVSVSK